MSELKKVIKPNVALSGEDLEGIIELLQVLLADEFTLYTKLRKYHWNVTGMWFKELHALFEDQYDQAAEIVDEVAEYIRMYGDYAFGTMKEFLENTRLGENPGVNPRAEDMLKSILIDHESLIKFLRDGADLAAKEYNDRAVEDLLTGYIHKHQKMAWMIRSHLER